MTSKNLVLCLCLFVSAFSLFKDDSAVFKLTVNNFKNTVLESDQFWMVEFYGNFYLI